VSGLRIGVNALYLLPGGVGGTEIYLRSLLDALGAIDGKNLYTLFTNRETGTELGPSAPNFRCQETRVRASFRPGRLLYEQVVLPFTTQLDVLFNPGFTAPVLSRCPQVTVFHDLQHKRRPEHFRWFDLPFWNLFLWASAKRSDRIIAVSEATRADVEKYYRHPRVTVIHHGVDDRMFDLVRTPRDYLLCVSTLHPHKNLDRLVRAFARVRKRHPEYRLVLAGLKGFHTAAVERLVQELGIAAAVSIPGWVPRERLYEMYASAQGFVYPSTFEGFGMPLLEAMAAGIPVACSAIEPLRSLAAGAALLFDPMDDAAMEDAIERVMSGQAPQGGRERARSFSWRNTAIATLATLEQAAAG
jgi:glycosyltransferase involved in cell wall biosynthesis